MTQPFFKDSELNNHDSLLIDEIESLPLDRQQDAIAILFGAMVHEYQSASEIERENMNPFVRFFAEMSIVQDADTETPQHFKNTEAAVTGIKFNLDESLAGGSIVNQ